MTSPPSSLSPPAAENASHPHHPELLISGARQVARFGCTLSIHHNIYSIYPTMTIYVINKLQSVWIRCQRSWVKNCVCILGPLGTQAEGPQGVGPTRQKAQLCWCRMLKTSFQLTDFVTLNNCPHMFFLQIEKKQIKGSPQVKKTVKKGTLSISVH